MRDLCHHTYNADIHIEKIMNVARGDNKIIVAAYSYNGKSYDYETMETICEGIGDYIFVTDLPPYRLLGESTVDIYIIDLLADVYQKHIADISRKKTETLFVIWGRCTEFWFKEHGGDLSADNIIVYSHSDLAVTHRIIPEVCKIKPLLEKGWNLAGYPISFSKPPYYS